MNTKVAFLCVGAQKCGTTTLRAYLREHPQLDVPGNEVHFFDNESRSWETCSAMHDYHMHFSSLVAQAGIAEGGVKSLGNCMLAGEVTPIYMYWLPSLRRIYQYNPSIKLVFLLRNPMARAYSHWSMEYRRGYESLPFSDAIRLEERRLGQVSYRQHRVYSYVDRGFYYKQVKRFLDTFPPENICILSAETFYRAPDLALRQISRFLGVDDFRPSLHHHRRRGAYDHPLTIDDWQYMHDRLSEDMSMLASKVSWDLSSWSIPPADLT
jgi:hypothetical protein